MKMNIKHYGAMTVLAFGLSSTASADFSGYYDISNWTVTDNAGGTVDTSTAPASITLYSGQTGVGGDTFFTITAPSAETISFNWSYVTNDFTGISAFDPFGYVINGQVTTLTNDLQYLTANPSPDQSGTAVFNVNAGDVFGFDANTFDGYGGGAVTVVSAFSAAPIPGAVWLFGSAITGLSCVSRRNRNSKHA